MMRAAVLAIALGATAAHAEFLDGNALLQRIQSTNATDSAIAVGYVIGVHDATRGSKHCSPDGISSGQVRDMVLRSLLAVPEKRHLTADLIIAATLGVEWPCAAKPNSRQPSTTL